MFLHKYSQDFKEEMQFRRRERGKGAPTKGLFGIIHLGGVLLGNLTH
jgi:hypothetical protein